MNNNFHSFENISNKSIVVKDTMEFILSSSDLSSYEYFDLINLKDNDIILHGLYLYYETIRQKDNSFQRLIKFFKDLDENKLILSSIDIYHSDIKIYDELYTPIGFDNLSGADLFYWYKEYREIYSYVKNHLSAGTYLKEFSENIGTITYFNKYNENIISLKETSFPASSASVKDYPIILNNKLPQNVIDFMDETTMNASLVQRNNVKNIVGSETSSDAHGDDLIVDSLHESRIDLTTFKNTLKDYYKDAYKLLDLFNNRIVLSSFEDFVYSVDSTLVDRLQSRIKYLLQ